MRELYKKKWAILEKNPPPHYLNKIIKKDFNTFRQNILEPTEAFVDEITSSLYSGCVYILEKTFLPEALIHLKQEVHAFGKKHPAAAEKILDGCPNFHYISDEHLERPKNGYVALDHSYYFFRWNQDPLKVFSQMDKGWEMVKHLGGFRKDEYSKNIPSDHSIDKIQIIHYPSGIGGISAHTDPFSRQKAIFGAMMTEPGKDYKDGGFFVLDRSKNKVNLEEHIALGSAVFLFPSLFHGVETIDKAKKPDWSKIDGRWFITSFTIDSHCVEKRETALTYKAWLNKAA